MWLTTGKYDIIFVAKEVDKLELTELKARDASCPKGKKMDLAINRNLLKDSTIWGYI